MPDVPRDGASTSAASLHTRIYSLPRSGLLISVVLALASIALISSFLTQKLFHGKPWRKFQPVQWIVVAIYIDSWMFVFATAMIQFGFGVDFSFSVCESAILLCLLCYISSKLVYLFLAEKAYIIRGKLKRRMKSEIYLFNSFGMLAMYTAVAALNFAFRITRVQNGQCIIGMQKQGLVPLIAFDCVANVYLTVIFLRPLLNSYTVNHAQHTQSSARLKRVARRTFVGAICTLTSSAANLSVLTALNGEPGWVCLMCCNSDILFSVVVIQCVTSPDQSRASDQSSKHDSHELESQTGESRRGRDRRNNIRALDDFDTPDVPDCSQSQASSRRELSTEAMIDGRAAISTSHNRTPSGSTDTLPSPKPFDLHSTAKPMTAKDKLTDANGNTDVSLPEKARLRDSNRHWSKVWRSGL